MQMIGSIHLGMDQGIKAKICQEDMVIFPECWKIEWTMDHFSKEVGDIHWDIQVDSMKNQPQYGENIKILHSTSRDSSSFTKLKTNKQNRT